METVTVSQAPAVSEVPAVVVPPTGGATMAALPSGVQVLFEPGGILLPGSGWRCCGRGCFSIGSGGSAVPFGSWW